VIFAHVFDVFSFERHSGTNYSIEAEHSGLGTAWACGDPFNSTLQTLDINGLSGTACRKVGSFG
jgi:hypothetical protein